MTSSSTNPTDYLADFGQAAGDFEARVRRIGFATVTTVDAAHRPRARVMQPVWETYDEGPVGWLITSERSPKVRDLHHNPHVSVGYWDPAHEMVFIEATAQAVDDPEVKAMVWDLFAAGEGSYGYDPHRFFPAGPTSPDYCCVRLAPTRIELSALADRRERRPRRIWLSGASE